jgi:serine/threonine-protein kinase
VGKEGDREVIVMEYLEGHSLASLLKRAGKRGQPLPLGLHLRLLMQVLEGLHFTHELQGYDGTPLYPVHRDVSPQNVIITYDGRVKLLDFGIAKAASSTTRTTTGLIKGKIAYMSPEQMGAQAVDRRADVYSVGCMLWAAAAGRRLWSDLTDVTIMHSVVTDAIPAPRSQNPDCDPELERIVMKALARLDLRYSSALELHEELERFCEAKGIPDRPRELGRVISELFVHDRAELRARIERELSLVESKLTFAAPEPRAQLEIATSADRPQRSSTRTLSATVNAISPRRTGRRRRWSWLAVGGTCTCLCRLLGAAAPAGATGGRRPTPVHAAAVTRAAASQPAIVTLELRSRPPTALLFSGRQAPRRQSCFASLAKGRRRAPGASRARRLSHGVGGAHVHR